MAYNFLSMLEDLYQKKNPGNPGTTLIIFVIWKKINIFLSSQFLLIRNWNREMRELRTAVKFFKVSQHRGCFN